MFELIFFGGVIGLSWVLLPPDHSILITLLGLILGVLSFIQGIRTEKLIREIREDIKETREMIKEWGERTQRLIQESSRETKMILDKMDERAEQRHREIMKEIIVK
jgi:predicted Holliday junction resolvase-like endonuclease